MCGAGDGLSVKSTRGVRKSSRRVRLKEVRFDYVDASHLAMRFDSDLHLCKNFHLGIAAAEGELLADEELFSSRTRVCSEMLLDCANDRF